MKEENKQVLTDEEFFALLGRRIQDLRLQHYSDPTIRTTFAEAIGISEEELSRIESGKEKVDSLLLHKISRLLSVPFHDFFIYIDQSRQERGACPERKTAKEMIELSLTHSPRTMSRLGHSARQPANKDATLANQQSPAIAEYVESVARSLYGSYYRGRAATPWRYLSEETKEEWKGLALVAIGVLGYQ